MNRPAARVRVNAEIDCLMQGKAEAHLRRQRAAVLVDHFGDEGLTLAQKRRREEALSYGDR